MRFNAVLSVSFASCLMLSSAVYAADGQKGYPKLKAFAVPKGAENFITSTYSYFNSTVKTIKDKNNYEPCLAHTTDPNAGQERSGPEPTFYISNCPMRVSVWMVGNMGQLSETTIKPGETQGWSCWASQCDSLQAWNEDQFNHN